MHCHAHFLPAAILGCLVTASHGCADGPSAIGAESEQDALSQRSGDGLPRVPVEEEAPDAQEESEDVFPHYPEARDHPPTESDSPGAPVCADGGPKHDVVVARWIGAPFDDAAQLLDDGTVELLVENVSEVSLDVGVAALVGNGSRSVEHAIGEARIDPGEVASFAVMLWSIRLNDPEVTSSENLLARVAFENPDSGMETHAFSSALYFHPEAGALRAYGPTVLREQFAGGDYLGIAPPSEAENPDDPPSVLLGAFVSHD